MKLSVLFVKSLKGFTLLEMLMSISVMTVITTVLIYKYPDTSVRLNLSNNSQTIALLLREAQVRGSAIDSANSALGGYGIFVALSAPDTVILFGDVIDSSVAMPNGLPVGDGLYATSTPLDNVKSITKFGTRYRVSKLCVGTGFPFTCNTSNTPAITSLVMSFTRPNPQPNIYINNSLSTGNFSAACIELRSPKINDASNATSTGHIRSIQIYNSGMIRTLANTCN